MQPAYIIADHLITPLGETTANVFNRMYAGDCSISKQYRPDIGTWYGSSFLNQPDPLAYTPYTRIEQMCIESIRKACATTSIDPSDSRILYLFATTKGNIELLTDKQPQTQRLLLYSMAKAVVDALKNTNKPLIVSNACISGVQAIQLAHTLLQEKKYTYAVICGCDVSSAFVQSGFHSFQAMSPFPCTPFDTHRAGLSLGEGCGTLILSLTQQENAIAIEGSASSNDANHISGPSRTGEGLSIAIQKVFHKTGRKAKQIQLINAHGTGTRYNDDMESLAFAACGLSRTPVNSLKGYIGHTLGAAGVIETILTAHSLQTGTLLPSAGFKEPGTTAELSVITDVMKGTFSFALKTASGFGGGNIALILKK